MRNFLIVLKYTILENARKKVFIISNIILVLLTVIVFNIPNIADSFSNKNDGKGENVKQRIAVIDEENVFQNALNNFQIPETNYLLYMEEATKFEQLKLDVADNKLSSVIVIDEKDGALTFDHIVKDERTALNADVISSLLKSAYMNLTLSKLNIDQTTLNTINAPITYEVVQARGEEISASSYILSIISSLILYFVIYFYGYSVSMSVSSEKTSRVMETLVTSAEPKSIVLGKTAAMGLLGLGQMLLLIITAILSYKFFVSSDLVILGEKIDFSSLTISLLFVVIIYFILGYCLYATLNAVTGATVSKAEDLQSAAMPVTFISLFSFYLGYFSLMSPTSSVTTFASIMPFSSAFTMPSRMMTTIVPAWQIILSIVLLIGTIILLAWLSIKIYSIAILQYGEKRSLRDLFKASKDI